MEFLKEWWITIGSQKLLGCVVASMNKMIYTVNERLDKFKGENLWI